MQKGRVLRPSACPGRGLAIGPTVLRTKGRIRRPTRWSTHTVEHWASVGPVIEQWAVRGMAGEGARGTAWICPPLPPTSPDCNTGTQRRTTGCGLESRIQISPSDEPRTWPGGSEAFEKDGRSLWMKQVTPASDVPLSQRPMSCWAASTALKRTGRPSHQLLPDNWPTGRPKLTMPHHHRQSDRQTGSACSGCWDVDACQVPFRAGDRPEFSLADPCPAAADHRQTNRIDIQASGHYADMITRSSLLIPRYE
jgi:hypothetical protein